MGYAVHQMLVYGSSGSVPALCRRFRAAGLSMVNGHSSADCLFHQFFALMDSVSHRHHQYRFAIESGHIHIFIRRNNNGFRIAYLIRRQHIGRPAGAIGLGLYRDPQLLPHILKVLCSHVSVSDSCGAGGNAENAVSGILRRLPAFPVLFRHLLFFLFTEAAPLRFIDHLQKSLGIFCCQKLFFKSRIH